MLARALLYLHTAMLAVGLIFERPVPLAIGP
jgi:hypothetical protein